MISRRLRFSLRTLFIVITLFACWLGYQLNWIKQRHEIAANHDLASVNIYEVSTKNSTLPFGTRTVRKKPTPQPNAPLALRLFGEEGRAYVLVYLPKSDPEFERIRKLFPEAKVFSDRDH